MPSVQLSFWGNYCITLEEVPRGAIHWYYSVTAIPGRLTVQTQPGEGPRIGPFPSDTAALEAARMHLVREKAKISATY